MRKALYIFLFAVLSSLQAFSQERVYLATDKDCYIAGDRIWCSAFCMDLSSKPIVPSGFSSTVYVELQSNVSVVQVAKIALIEGRGAGAIEIAPDLPTGNYRLLAYTAQNKNEEGFAPEGKVITIFNTLSTEREADNVILVESETLPGSEYASKAFAAGKHPFIEVSLPQNGQKTSSEVPVTIKNITKDAVSLSVSIYHFDGLGVLPASSIEEAVAKMNNLKTGTISKIEVPDYEGEVIRLKTTNISEGLVSVSFPGKVVDYYTSNVESDGEVLVYTPNIYGNKDMICEIVANSIPDSWSLEIQDPYIKEVQGDMPQLAIGPYMDEKLQQRGFAMQVERRFEADTLFQHLPIRRNTFLNGEKVVYKLDEYTRFPLMEEVIIEFVKELKVRKVQKQQRVLVNNSERSLMLLDGVPVFDHKKIIEYDPLLVKKITIYPGVYSTGIRYYEGVACFETYKGDIPSYSFSDNVKILPFKGALVPLAFTGSNVLKNKNYPDYRQTIYWHPIIEIPAGEAFDFKCITPLYEGVFEVVVEGVSASGEPIFYKSTFSTL